MNSLTYGATFAALTIFCLAVVVLSYYAGVGAAGKAGECEVYRPAGGPTIDIRCGEGVVLTTVTNF
jgi:hypothetical protein